MRLGTKHLIGMVASCALVVALTSTVTWVVVRNIDDAEGSAIETLVLSEASQSESLARLWFQRAEETTRLLSLSLGTVESPKAQAWFDGAQGGEQYAACILYDRVDGSAGLPAWESRVVELNPGIPLPIDIRLGRRDPPWFLITTGSNRVWPGAVGIDVSVIRGDVIRTMGAGDPWVLSGFSIGAVTDIPIVLVYHSQNASDPSRRFVSCSVPTDTLTRDLQAITLVDVTVVDPITGLRISNNKCPESSLFSVSTHFSLRSYTFNLVATACPDITTLTSTDSKGFSVGVVVAMGILVFVFLVSGFVVLKKDQRSTLKLSRLQVERRTVADIVMTVFHDIRNPIHVAGNAMRIMADREGTSMDRELTVASENLRTAEGVINGLQELQASLEYYAEDTFSFVGFCSDVKHRWGIVAYSDVTMEFGIRSDFDIPDLLVGQLVRINQLVSIAIAGAIKRSLPGDDIHISIHLARCTRGVVQIKIEVSSPLRGTFDEVSSGGPCASPNHIDAYGAFQWSRGSGTSSRVHQDVDARFGASMAESLAALAGGHISIKVLGSGLPVIEGVGSPGAPPSILMFSVCMPVRICNDPPHGSFPDDDRFADVTVGIITNTNPDRIRAMVGSIGVRSVVLWDSPEDAIGCILRSPPTVVLVSTWLDGASGESVIRRMGGAQTRFIMMTSSTRSLSSAKSLSVLHRPSTGPKLAEIILDQMQFV